MEKSTFLSLESIPEDDYRSGHSIEAIIALSQGYVPFGPNANCTLGPCPLDLTIFHYLPSLGWNVAFVCLFAIVMCVHIGLGIRWKSWWFMTCMIMGCVGEIIGYAGRLMLHSNPFSFSGFMTQIVCITTGPVFYSAAIYFTIAKLVDALEPSVSRIRPQLYYWVFIICDILCLVLQAVGGIWSVNSSGDDQSAIDVSVAGLGFQVTTLVVFLGLVTDYMVRYFLSVQGTAISMRLKVFLAGIFLAILLILARCSYRVHELKEGYSGETFRDEAMFIGLEGVLVVGAVVSLCFGHPGLLFNNAGQEGVLEPKKMENGEERK